jgi:citrate lyase beta subunit
MADARVGAVRSALFTPGTEAARLRKAVTVGADVCIFDLEDSVPLQRIAEARTTVAGALNELHGQAQIWVRVHSGHSAEMAQDVAALPLEKADGVALPKVNGCADVEKLRIAMATSRVPALPIVAMIETARGVLACADIADMPGVVCLAFGRFDLSADLGIDPDGGSPALSAGRAAVVLASRAAGLLPPIDAPWIRIDDLSGLRAAAQRARADGFGGLQLIHPSHVPVVNEVFSPTAAEIKWARGIVESAGEAEAHGRGAYKLDGQMVDEAIVKRARAILAIAGSSAGGGVA